MSSVRAARRGPRSPVAKASYASCSSLVFGCGIGLVPPLRSGGLAPGRHLGCWSERPLVSARRVCGLLRCCGRVPDRVSGEHAEGGEDGQGEQRGPQSVDEAGGAEVAAGAGEDGGGGGDADHAADVCSVEPTPLARPACWGLTARSEAETVVGTASPTPTPASSSGPAMDREAPGAGAVRPGRAKP